MLMPSIFGEDLFDDFWGFGYPVRGTQKENADAVRKAEVMKTDVKEHEDHYELEISLPGYQKEDIRAELKDGYLTIKASTSQSHDETDEKTGRYIRRERYTGSCSRSFFVGEEVKQEEIKAKYENGVLALSIPKEEPQKPKAEEKKYITIEG